MVPVILRINFFSEDSCLSVKEDVRGIADRTLEDKLAHVITELTKEEEMFQVEQNMQKQVNTVHCIWMC